MSDDDGAQPAPFTYLHLRTPYGPGGGPGPLAAYAAAAAGYSALACSDYGTVAAWPEWERACRQAGLRPIYGLGFDLRLESAARAPTWPLLALAATAAGLRHLVQIHNRLALVGDRCVLDVAALPDLAAGLWLVLLPAGDHGASPLVALPRAAALAAVARLGKSLPRPEGLLCGLPPGAAEQGYFAELAAAAGIPLLALPVVRYPRESDAPAHAILRAAAQPPPDNAPATLESALEAIQDPAGALAAIQNPQSTIQNYAAYPEAGALAGAVAESCRAVLADLVAPDPESAAAADAQVAAAVDEALAAAGQTRDPAIEAELVALGRLGCAAELLAARRVAAVARRLGIALGAAGGVAGEGRVPALLGLCPAGPFGAAPSWLEATGPAPVWTPVLTVPAGRRRALLAALQDDLPGAHREMATSLLVPAGGRHARGPAAAVADLRRAIGLPAPIAAGLEQALVAGRPGERPVRWRAALPADLPPGAGDALLAWTVALEALPGPPLADAEALLVLPVTHSLPLLPLPELGAQRAAVWSAPDCAALGARLLLLRGDAGLDIAQRARDLTSALPEAVPADAMRLLLVSGELGGLPLPPVPAGASNDLALTPDVLAAVCAALLPDDPADAPGWAALGALLYGAGGPHPLLRTYLRRRVGAAPVTYHYPALAPILDLTWGLPLYDEQVRALRRLLGEEGQIPPGQIAKMQEWIDQTAGWASRYAVALAAGEQVHRALRLKVAQPAAFLAAALEAAVLRGEAAAVQTLALEARRRDIALRPPDVQVSNAGFALEDGAIRWGLAGSPAMLPAATALVAARGRRPAGRLGSLAALCAAAAEVGAGVSLLGALIRAGACDSLGARGELLAALPAAVEEAARARAATQAPADTGQAGLFDILAAAPASPAADMAAVLPPSPRPEAPSSSADPPGPAAADAPAAESPHSAFRTPQGEPWGLPHSARRAWEVALTGHAFTPPAAAEALGRAGGPAKAGAIARLTLGDISATLVGQTVSVVGVLGNLRVLPADGSAKGAEGMAVALLEDGDARLPLVLFPPVYTLAKTLIQSDAPLIVVARVQLAEAAESAGAPVVLIGEQVHAFATQRVEQELDLTVRKRREPAPAAARPAKPASDSAQYSTSGQRYFNAPRPGAATAASPAAPAPPPAAAGAPAAGQVVITLAPLANEQDDEERMLHLKDILRRYPGPTAVLLYFPDDPAVGLPTTMPLKRTVAVSPDFCTEVEALLGAGCYAVQPSA